MKHKFENVNPETPCNDVLMKLRKTYHPCEANVNLRHAQAYKLSKVSTREGQIIQNTAYILFLMISATCFRLNRYHRAPYKSK